jgi:hypothetical protein
LGAAFADTWQIFIKEEICMKNRIASLFLVFAMLMSLCNFAVARDNRITVQSGGAEKFTDVPTDHWAYAYINKVVGSGLFNGKTATTFEPSNAMTRSQFVLVMDRMEGMQSLEGQYTTTIFPDVAPSRLAAGPIKWANEQGFVLGFGDGTFKPDSPITRGQFAALIHRYIIAKRYTNLHVVDPEPAQFTDAGSVSSAFTADVEYARVHGLLTGYSDGTVRASNPITRAAIAAILARFLDLVTESGYTPLLDGPEPGTTPGTDGPETPPVDVPTSYKQIKLNITNSKHGTTTFLSVLRNGVQVASDDVQPGDVVTISHVPESGYRVKITVKDSKGKTVDVTTNGNVSTFVAPENLPVTITLKYLKESTGGSGSGSGSSSGGGGGGGTGGQPITQTTTYYLTVNATAGTGGSVYLTTTPPTTDAVIPSAASAANSAVGATASYTFNRANASGSIVIGYAVFVPNEDYTFVGATASTGVTLNPAQAPYTSNTVSMKRSDAADAQSVNVTYIQITANGVANQQTPASVSVNGTFNTSSGGGGGNEPATTYTWTVNVTNGNHANYQLVETYPASPAAFTTATKDGKIELKDIAANTEKSVYLVVSPESGYKFGDVEPDVAGSATISCVYPTTQAETDTVRVYQITRTITANTTTGVSILMQLENGAGKTYAVVAHSFLWNGATEIQMPDDASQSFAFLTETAKVVPVRASVDKNPATYLNKVTVSVPLLSGYSGYQFRSIAVTGPDSNPVDYKTEKTDAAGNEYSFIMPDGPTTVKVVYEPNANADLNYDVHVTFNGQGTASLNIAGLTQTTDKETTYHVKMSEGAVIVTEGDDATGAKMKQSDYVELYGNNNFTQSVSLTATPVAAKGYRFTSATIDGTAVSQSNITAARNFASRETPLEVVVNFSQINYRGYNLTIVGKGSVEIADGDFKTAKPYTNPTDLPQSYSSGLIESNASNLTLTATPTVANGKNASHYDVLINGASGTSVPLNTDGTLTDIIVEFYEKDRNAVKFTVEVVDGTGEVNVKPISGGFMLADGYTATTAKDFLKNNTNTLKTVTLSKSDNLKSYFAYENSVITITPSDSNAETVKVKEIKVTDASGETLSDVMDAKGFSFQLTAPADPDATTDAKVTFGAFDSYSVSFLAPDNDNASTNDTSLRSVSTNIDKSQTATVQEVLYSLNNGQRTSVTTFKGITNDFAAPATLNTTLSYYLRNRVVKDDNGFITGAESVKKTLEETVSDKISTIFPSVVEAKKADLKADLSTVTTPLKTQMESRQAEADTSNAQPREITGALKSSILEATSFGDQLKAGTLKEKDFRVSATVTMILSKQKENDLKLLYPAIANDLTGKSAEAQLTNFATDYLSKIQVAPGYNYGNLTPSFTVTPSAPNNVPTLDISASVTATGNRWPSLDTSVTMTSYADSFNIWVLAQISDIRYDASGNQNFDSVQPITLPDSVRTPKLYSSAQLGVSTDLTSVLSAVDGKVVETWNSQFGSSVAIDMGKVLSKELLDQVVEGIIEEPSNTLTTKVGSLGNGDNTRSAFMNLYRDLVVFGSSDTESLLNLKTKDGGLTSIGDVSGSNLVLTLNFENILRDSATPTDNTSFEQLVNLIVGLRDGMSTDIRVTSESSNSKQSPQSVIASMILTRLNSGKGFSMTAKKWSGAAVSAASMSDMEKKELANLLAAMLMNSEMDQPFDSKSKVEGTGANARAQGVWKSFEDSGYQSVKFSVILDAGKRDGLSSLLKSYYGVTDLNESNKTLKVGFEIAQVIN